MPFYRKEDVNQSILNSLYNAAEGSFGEVEGPDAFGAGIILGIMRAWKRLQDNSFELLPDFQGNAEHSQHDYLDVGKFVEGLKDPQFKARLLTALESSLMREREALVIQESEEVEVLS